MSKVILITGTTKGLGLDLAKRYLDHGYYVCGCGRNESKIENPSYTHFCLDINDESQLVSMFRDIKRKHQRLDILINNAAMAGMNHFMLMPRKMNSEIMDVNVTSAISAIREASKLMIGSNAGSGRIINFSSIAVYHALEGQMAYSASKAAIEHLTRTASKELAAQGITVNCVSLPYLRTSLSRTIGVDRIKNLLQLQTIKRQCKFSDVFNILELLIDHRSDLITGETLNLAGV